MLCGQVPPTEKGGPSWAAPPLPAAEDRPYWAEVVSVGALALGEADELFSVDGAGAAGAAG